MSQDKDLKKLLEFDSLHKAENLTGKSYKEDEATTRLGMALHIANVQAKRNALRAAKDTHYESTLEEYLEVVEDLGFRLFNKIEFKNTSPYCSYKGTEVLYMFWHDEYSVLLCFDTWEGRKVNSGNFYYQHKQSKTASDWVYSSGHYVDVDNSWIGYHDCREGLRFKLNRLLDSGEFQTKWSGQGAHVWATHHGEKDNLFGGNFVVAFYQPDIITQERLKVDEKVWAAVVGGLRPIKAS